MNRTLQIKIIIFIISIILSPLVLLGGIFLAKYNSFLSNNKYKYVEMIRINAISLIKERIDLSEERLLRLENIVKQNNEAFTNNDFSNLLSKEMRLELTEQKGFKNAYFLDEDLNLYYRVFQDSETLEDIKEIIDKEVIDKITYKSILNKGIFYKLAILAVEDQGKNKGFIVVVSDNSFFDLDILKTIDVTIDIYDDDFNIIKSNSNKRIFVKEINDDTKNMLSGNSLTEVNKNRAISYGYIDLGGDDFFLMVSLNEDKYIKSDSFRLYIFVGTIMAILIVFVLGWKLIGYLNLYIDRSIENKEYDDYTPNKFRKDLEKNITNIDRIVGDLTDFQVLKQDLMKLNERFSEGSDIDEGHKRKK